MEVSVGEAANALGLSPRRVRALIEAGRLQARRVGGVWLIEGASLPSESHRSRPMVLASAWALLDDKPPADRRAAHRWRERRNRLRHDSAPERLLASWVISRGDRRLFESRDAENVLADVRVVASGLSDERAGIVASSFAEGYVRADDLAAVRREHLLRPGGPRSNVVLHVVDALPPSPVPLLVLAADLAEHDQPRELGRAHELIREALA